MGWSTLRVLALGLALAATAAQTAAPAPQLLLDNESVRVLRVTIPAKTRLNLGEKSDAVVVRLEDESARFIPADSPFTESNETDHDATDLIIDVKRHWAGEMRTCSYPKKCTQETQLGQEPVAWTTTLFTNGFVTAATHKVVAHGSLTSSYYTAKGSDRILVIPFTNLKVSFGGIEENLKAGQPYFSIGTEVEVTSKEDESRWFVLRISLPGK